MGCPHAMCKVIKTLLRDYPLAGPTTIDLPFSASQSVYGAVTRVRMHPSPLHSTRIIQQFEFYSNNYRANNLRCNYCLVKRIVCSNFITNDINTCGDSDGFPQHNHRNTSTEDLIQTYSNIASLSTSSVCTHERTNSFSNTNPNFRTYKLFIGRISFKLRALNLTHSAPVMKSMNQIQF